MKKILLALALMLLLPFSALAAEETLKIYVREGCPHCANVKEFVTTNELDDQVEYIETFNNVDNQAEMEKWFDDLDVPAASRGVPFMLYNDNESFEVGDTPIVAYLAAQNDLEVVEAEYQAGTSDYILLGIGGLFVVGILGYGIYTVFMSDDN